MTTVESGNCFKGDCYLSCSICPRLKEHKKRRMKMELSKFCEECLKFTTGECEGKKAYPKNAAFWGTEKSVYLSGTDFCKRYEFDVRLYTFADGSGKTETLKEAVQRGDEKREVEDNQEAFDDFDLGASLSSKDFEGLI